MRSLTTIIGNSQKLDGGAMFGNAPRLMWDKWLKADDKNQIDLACRCLLVREDNRNILIETGIGAFFSPQMKERFGVQENNHVLLDGLKKEGLSHEDIDIVVLTHLHFDHAGGMLSEYVEGEPLKLLFPNAKIITGKSQFERAKKPHSRDKASYIKELIDLLENSGRLELIDDTQKNASLKSETLGDDWSFFVSEGHTPGQILPIINMPSGPVIFTGDLVPGAPWVHVPITMGYDRFPEALIDEKSKLLESLLANNGRLVFTHDPNIAVGRLVKNEKGKFSLIETMERMENIIV